MSPILRRLRDETADLHLEAERHVRILDGDASEATYARYLRRMLGFHAPMEARFAAHAGLAAVGFDAPSRCKAPLLRADLSALGASTDVEVCGALPIVDDSAAALGAAYVIEGSTLGGPFIRSRMAPVLANRVAHATRFLAGYRDQTGPRWRAFAAIAERSLVAEDDRAQAVASARATFAALTAWLDEPAADPPHPRTAASPRRVEPRA